MASQPITDEDRDAVSRLHAQGLGRNAIARALGRGPRTVSVIASGLGLTFDVTMTEAATRARVAQLAEKRSILADALTDDALRLTEQLWQPTTVYNFGGKDNTYEERLVDEPPAIDKKALMTAAGAAIDRSLRLVPPEQETGEDAARSMLGKMMSGLQQVWQAQQDQQSASGDEGDDAR